MSSQNIRSLDKKKIELSVGAFTLCYFCIVLVLASFAGSFFLFLQSVILEDSYREAYNLAKIYEKSQRSADTAFDDLLAETDSTFVVRDKYGSTVYQLGVNSCSKKTVCPGISLDGNERIIYLDTVNDNLRFYQKGYIAIPNLTALKNPDRWIVDGQSALHNSDSTAALAGTAKLDYWVPVRLSDDGEFIVKCSITLEKQSVIVVKTVGACFLFFILLVFVCYITAIIRNGRYQNEMKEMFFTDEITGGNNWMAFLIQGEQILKKQKNTGRHYAVINLSVVKYRNYCICHSIAKGEKVLKRIANIIGQKCTANREICAHTSSGFVIMWEMKNEKTLTARLEKLTDKLKYVDPNHIFQYHIGAVSVEPAKLVFPKGKNNILEKFYNNACAARGTLEHRDDSGIAFFNKELVSEQKWVNTVHERQQKALQNEEFVVYYQPKYSPGEGKLRGAEALVRWQSKEFGLISPGKFIPIFEKNGFVTEIDHYMLRHVARDQRAWLDAGLDCVPISVNISRAHFAEEDLAEQIRDTVDKEGTPHHLIEIELTESAFFDDKDAIINTINRLKQYGFSVSMDDFGSGYSSLNSLKDMNLDVLKLDAEFFRGDADQRRKEAVVGEAIKLAKSLNMKTVAEGVEDESQVKFLAEQGCDMIQSYYFAKPMPKKEFEEQLYLALE